MSTSWEDGYFVMGLAAGFFRVADGKLASMI